MQLPKWDVQASLKPGCSAFGKDASDIMEDLLRNRELSLGMPAVSHTS